MTRRTTHVPVNDFQRWFEAALERRGIGLRELATAVETDYSHLWKIVRGNQEKYATSKRPGYELTVKIGEFFGDVEGAKIAAKYDEKQTEPIDTPKPTDLATPKFIQTIRDEEFGEMTLRFYEGFIFNGKMVYVSSEYEFTNQQVIEAAVLLRAGMLKRA